MQIKKKRVKVLQEQIAKRVAEIRHLQANCEHPHATKIAKSDTGNYDKSDDSYWYKCKCPDCLQEWIEDQ